MFDEAMQDEKTVVTPSSDEPETMVETTEESTEVIPEGQTPSVEAEPTEGSGMV